MRQQWCSTAYWSHGLLLERALGWALVESQWWHAIHLGAGAVQLALLTLFGLSHGVAVTVVTVGLLGQT